MQPCPTGPTPRRPQFTVLAALLLVLGASALPATTCQRGITLSSSFESATWVVLASVAVVERGGSRTTAALVVEEQFKGPELETFVISAGRRWAGGRVGLAEGERWLLFLHRSQEDDSSPGWPRQCSGSLALESEHFADAARAETHLAALRSRPADSAAPPRDPWLFRERAGASCVISKVFRGPLGIGHLALGSTGDRAHLAAGFFPKREWSQRKVDDPRDLRIDIDGEVHEVAEYRYSPRMCGYYRTQDGAAELLFNALQRLAPRHVQVSLGEDFVTEVGVYGLQTALAELIACRERERPPSPGWIEVLARPDHGRQEPLRFSWSLAHADTPTEPIMTGRRNWDWEALSAGGYVVEAECYGQRQRQRVQVVEGETERLYIDCGDPAHDP